jgi:hypothetical protein
MWTFSKERSMSAVQWKKWMLRWVMLVAGMAGTGSALAVAPVVSNVRAAQRAGTGWVDIYYNVGDPDSPSLTVAVAVSTNNGVTYDLPAWSFTNGNPAVKSIGHGVAPGNDRWIMWNAYNDWPGKYNENVKFRTTWPATSGNGAGIGMAIATMLRRPPRTPEDRQLAPTACYGAAVGNTSRAIAGWPTAATSVRATRATASSGSGLSGGQDCKRLSQKASHEERHPASQPGSAAAVDAMSSTKRRYATRPTGFMFPWVETHGNLHAVATRPRALGYLHTVATRPETYGFHGFRASCNVEMKGWHLC